jgi:hypothetical protein
LFVLESDSLSVLRSATNEAMKQAPLTGICIPRCHDVEIAVPITVDNDEKVSALFRLTEDLLATTSKPSHIESLAVDDLMDLAWFGAMAGDVLNILVIQGQFDESDHSPPLPLCFIVSRLGTGADRSEVSLSAVQRDLDLVADDADAVFLGGVTTGEHWFP